MTWPGFPEGGSAGTGGVGTKKNMNHSGIPLGQSLQVTQLDKS